MSKLFVAYTGENPTAVDIKGHRLVILSNSLEDMTKGLPLLGADAVREIEVTEEDPASLAGLAASVQGGVVVSPNGTPVALLLLELEKELPWVH